MLRRRVSALAAVSSLRRRHRPGPAYGGGCGIPGRAPEFGSSDRRGSRSGPRGCRFLRDSGTPSSTPDGRSLWCWTRPRPSCASFGVGGLLETAFAPRGVGPGEAEQPQALAVSDDRILLLQPGRAPVHAQGGTHRRGSDRLLAGIGGSGLRRGLPGVRLCTGESRDHRLAQGPSFHRRVPGFGRRRCKSGRARLARASQIRRSARNGSPR